MTTEQDGSASASAQTEGVRLKSARHHYTHSMVRRTCFLLSSGKGASGG